MDKSTIVLSVHVAYCIIIYIISFVRQGQYPDKVAVRKEGDQVSFEFFGYTLAGVGMFVMMVSFPFVRNRLVFDHSFPVTFIAQFIVQFLILVFYLIDTKATRYMASYGIASCLIFMFLNGLFRMEIESTKLELTTAEVQKISNDLDDFSNDVTNRIQKINDDMNLVLYEIKEKQKQIDAVNTILKEKDQEHQKVQETLEVDKEKAEALLKALGVKQPTIWDRIIDAGIGAALGLFVSIIWNRLFGRKNPVTP